MGEGRGHKGVTKILLNEILILLSWLSKWTSQDSHDQWVYLCQPIMYSWC